MPILSADGGMSVSQRARRVKASPTFKLLRSRVRKVVQERDCPAGERNSNDVEKQG